MHSEFHLAPGLGELLPGWFNLPQNPLRLQAEGISYVPHIGELMPAKFTIPENPIREVLEHGWRGHSAGCSCGGTCDKCSGGLSGLGVLGLPETVFGVPTAYLLYGAGALLLLGGLSFRPQRKRYRAELGAAREKHKAEVAKIRRKYPRVGGRVSRSARAAYGAF